MDHKTKIGIIIDDLESSPEMEIHRNLEALKASYRVFAGNYSQLLSYTEHLNNPRESLYLYSCDQKENLDILIDETSRLFHNFLAAAKSLIDHTRVIVKRLYSNKEFENEYKTKLDQEIGANPVQKLVQNLRNYTLHYTLPILGLQITFTGDIEMNVCIDVAILKQWSKWGPSMSYLENSGDRLCLISLSSEYFTLIQNFYHWLINRQKQIHQSDIENLQKMKNKLQFE